MYSFCNNGFNPFPSGGMKAALMYRKGFVRKTVIERKNSVDELAKAKSQGVKRRGYDTQAIDSAATKQETKKHHSNIEPSIPPQMAVIL